MISPFHYYFDGTISDGFDRYGHNSRTLFLRNCILFNNPREGDYIFIVIRRERLSERLDVIK